MNSILFSITIVNVMLVQSSISLGNEHVPIKSDETRAQLPSNFIAFHPCLPALRLSNFLGIVLEALGGNRSDCCSPIATGARRHLRVSILSSILAPGSLVQD